MKHSFGAAALSAVGLYVTTATAYDLSAGLSLAQAAARQIFSPSKPRVSAETSTSDFRALFHNPPPLRHAQLLPE